MNKGQRTTAAASLFLLLLIANAAFAQHGSAPDGYYPTNYGGDTWTGTVTAADDNTREITLKYTNGDRTETFTGVLRPNYQVTLKDGSKRELKPSDIAVGRTIRVFYLANTRKLDGKKIKYYEIFRIDFPGKS